MNRITSDEDEAHDRVQALLARRRARFRRITIAVWVVAILSVFGSAYGIHESWEAKRVRDSAVFDDHPMRAVDLDTYETARDRWRIRADWWRAEWESTSEEWLARNTDTIYRGQVFITTDDELKTRYNDAERILSGWFGSVESSLEDLRRAEALQDADGMRRALNRLEEYRREWEALVVNAPRRTPGGAGIRD